LNESLKYGKGIGETKRHNKIFEKTKRGAEGRLPLISFLNVNEVEGVLQIDDQEELTTLSAIEEVVNVRKWIIVSSGDGIEATVIHAKS
jgi:hypothetical protein